MRGGTALILFLLVLVTIVVTQKNASTGIDYKSWKAKFKPNSNVKGTQQKNETQLEKTFNANAARIAKHNSNKNATYSQELNANADMTANEIKKNRKGLVPEVVNKTTDKSLSSVGNSFANKITRSSASTKISPADSTLNSVPKSLNLTSMMTPVKNQLDCGSCWAFATLSVIEYWARKNQSNVTFSEQSLMDCCTTNSGCDGGGLRRSFLCMINIGVALSSKYAYKAINQKCPKKATPDYKMPNGAYSDIEGDEDILVMLLNKYGPIVVAIATDNTGFNFYKNGVFYDPNCSNDPTMADHAVVVVGYGTANTGGDFWIVRNSWGPDWGLNGYIHIARNRNNSCGVANSVAFYLRS